jgi:hypothetical protein
MFSVGAMFYYLATFFFPFTNVAILAAENSAMLPPPSFPVGRYSKSFVDLILKLLRFV